MSSKLMTRPASTLTATATARVRIAVVGLNFGRLVVEELCSAPVNNSIELAAVCDLDHARAAEVADQYSVPVASLDELLNDPTIEAIGLFTGPVGRAKLIEKIIRAGKHVMTTKPFELDPVAAAAVLEEARRLGRIVHLNSPGPRLPNDLQQVRVWERKFALGRPIAFRREVWASYREQADGTWYDDPKLCPVAPIFRLGIYLINDMIRLFGSVDAVQVMHSRIFTGRPTPDNAQLTLQFASGVIGNIFASFCIDDGQHYGNTMTLNYERGTIYRNAGPHSYGMAHAQSNMSVVARIGPEQTTTEYADLGDSSNSYQWPEFAHAIRRGRSPEQVSDETIVAGIRVISAMARSEQSGCMERVLRA
jgi:predicted dehydrogenase